MIWFDEDGKTGTQAPLKADGTSDVANLPAFAKAHDLKPGSNCFIIQTSQVYMMQSDETWKSI